VKEFTEMFPKTMKFRDCSYLKVSIGFHYFILLFTAENFDFQRTSVNISLNSPTRQREVLEFYHTATENSQLNNIRWSNTAYNNTVIH